MLTGIHMYTYHSDVSSIECETAHEFVQFEFEAICYHGIIHAYMHVCTLYIYIQRHVFYCSCIYNI